LVYIWEHPLAPYSCYQNNQIPDNMKLLYKVGTTAFLLLLPCLLTAQNLIVREVNPQDVTFLSAESDRDFDVFQERLVSIDRLVLALDQINFNLFDGVSFVGQKDPSVKTVNQGDWIGRLDGIDEGYALINEKDDQFYAKIETGERQFFIYSFGDAYKVIETNKDNAKDEIFDDGIVLDQINNLNVCEAGSTCVPDCVTMLVVYTDSAMVNLGGTAAAAEAAIDAAVNEFNLVLDNTGVSHDACLVHTEMVDYEEEGSTSQDVGRLRSQTDGFVDNVHVLRNLHLADLVHMIVGAGCGSGYVNSDPNNYRDDLAFAVTSNLCMTTNLTFPHEAGHNLGLHHDWFANQSTTPCEWHHGFYNNGDVGDRWRTVMSYNSGCSPNSCPRQPYFSNPLNTFGPNNSPMGLRNQVLM